MSWPQRIRVLHRWTSAAFAAAVAAVFAAQAFGAAAEWVYFLPLAPLALLFPTGVWLFVLPYARRGAGATTED